jgi:cold shock CspA family protein/ribosome-associated translation inhibitor RaiA
MSIPVKITYRHVPPSDSLSKHIQKRAAKLEEFSQHVIECHAVVEEVHNHHGQKHFLVEVVAHVPGETLVAHRDDSEGHDHDDAYQIVTRRFLAIRRQLQAYARRTHHEVKRHTGPPDGRVSKVFTYEGYGFITTTDGREIYFHQNSVIDGRFDDLSVGDEVRFIEEMGEEGPQATTVRARPAAHALRTTGAVAARAEEPRRNGA